MLYCSTNYSSAHHLNIQCISEEQNSHDDLLRVEDVVMQQHQEETASYTGTQTLSKCMLICQ
jgi:hypothetical protein